MSELKNTDEKINELLNLLSIYYTARIDFKNAGNYTNSIEVIDSSDNLNITFPKWFKNHQGTGMVITSENNQLDLRLKCIKNGLLYIYLRGLDVKDKNKNRFPVYIDYSSLIINGKEYIEENKLIWHDEPFLVTKNVKNNELITIHAEWKPFNSSSLYENKKLSELEEEIEKLKDKNKKLENKLKETSESNFLEIKKLFKN